MEIRISPDLRIVSDRLSRMSTDFLRPIIVSAAEETAPEVEETIKAFTPVATGASRDSIHVTTSLGRGRGARLSVYGKDTLQYVIKGTPPHVIHASAGKTLSFVDSSGTLRFTREVHHPGSQPNNFVDRAWDVMGPKLSRAIRERGLRMWRDFARGNRK